MLIEGLLGTYEVSSELSSFFRLRVKRDGVIIHEGETVVDYVNRCGFPFTVEYQGLRNDN
jgi:hypothetical protein